MMPRLILSLAPIISFPNIKPGEMKERAVAPSVVFKKSLLVLMIICVIKYYSVNDSPTLRGVILSSQPGYPTFWLIWPPVLVVMADSGTGQST